MNELQLPIRVANAVYELFRARGVDVYAVTVEDIASVETMEWMRLRNFGRKSLLTLNAALAGHGLGIGRHITCPTCDGTGRVLVPQPEAPK